MIRKGDYSRSSPLHIRSRYLSQKRIKMMISNTKVWKNTLITLRDKLQGDDISNRLKSLRSTARLCAHEYGDAVHWARAMLLESEDDDYSRYDNCRNASVPRFRKEPSGNTNTSVNIYPVPSTGQLTIELPNDWTIGSMVIYDLHGRLVWSKSNIELIKFDINPALSDGSYIVKLSPLDGESTIKKIVIIK